jgi:hypothetical protein
MKRPLRWRATRLPRHPPARSGSAGRHRDWPTTGTGCGSGPAVDRGPCESDTRIGLSAGRGDVGRGRLWWGPAVGGAGCGRGRLWAGPAVGGATAGRTGCAPVRVGTGVWAGGGFGIGPILGRGLLRAAGAARSPGAPAGRDPGPVERLWAGADRGSRAVDRDRVWAGAGCGSRPGADRGWLWPSWQRVGAGCGLGRLLIQRLWIEGYGSAPGVDRGPAVDPGLWIEGCGPGRLWIGVGCRPDTGPGRMRAQGQRWPNG